VLRRHGLIKPSLQERVETALASIRPTLASHGGDVELVRVLPPAAVEVRFLGNCDNCPASVLTFTAGVKRAIKEHCPEITEIRQARGQGGGSGAVHYVSPFAKNRAGAWHEVLPLAALEDGGARMLTVAGEALILSRQGDRVSCFRNACAHLGMPLDGGEIKDGIITCPHHGFEYDLLSGECLTAAEVQLEPFVVRVVDDRVDVQLGA
jgi:nitrite reductase/ring-hydroxylating ferredoxin subunit/Fe-S cluster biogenesis protein NfuA